VKAALIMPVRSSQRELRIGAGEGANKGIAPQFGADKFAQVASIFFLKVDGFTPKTR
jgi:hypothetical protein